MVAKCANPGCSAPFLYMRQGKLFRMETLSSESGGGPNLGTDSTFGRSARHLEFFWLCDDCAPKMTLTAKPGRGVVVQKVDQAAVAIAAAL